MADHEICLHGRLPARRSPGFEIPAKGLSLLLRLTATADRDRRHAFEDELPFGSTDHDKRLEVRSPPAILNAKGGRKRRWEALVFSGLKKTAWQHPIGRQAVVQRLNVC